MSPATDCLLCSLFGNMLLCSLVTIVIGLIFPLSSTPSLNQSKF